MIQEQVTCINNHDPIVMVDDNEIDVSIAKRVHSLSKLKNPFAYFFSGNDFLKYMEDSKLNINPTPALVLLDINMPGMNGFDVLVELRKHPEFAHIPIVSMFTNSANRSDMEKSIECGAQSFKTKPIGIEPYLVFFNSLTAD